jgi:hypothetical protein
VVLRREFYEKFKLLKRRGLNVAALPPKTSQTKDGGSGEFIPLTFPVLRCFSR